MKQASFKPSPQQAAIFQEFKNGESHVQIQARAGTGKTTTVTHGVLYTPEGQDVMMLAFNVHNAADTRNKLAAMNAPKRIQALTYNSFGWRAYRMWKPNAEIDEHKLESIAAGVVDEKYQKYVMSPVCRVSRLLKAYLLEPSPDNIDLVIDKFGFDWSKFTVEQVKEFVPEVLRECLAMTQVVDFDDQIWMTVKHEIPIPAFDTVVIDEAQDTSTMQKRLVEMACPSGRIVFVGDSRQAIFAFRGADANSMTDLESAFAKTERGCKTLKLTVTRRCPKSHVDMAQSIVPDIEALPNAPEGTIQSIDDRQFFETVQPGDLVLCRVNAPLVGHCYRLIRNGVKAQVRGRDIGTGLKSLISKLKANTMVQLMYNLKEYRDNEGARLLALGRKGEGRYAALQDRCDCLIEISEGAKTVEEVSDRIEKVFAKTDEAGHEKLAVTLGTCHRTKGLESPRVLVLNPELLPHPMAKQPFEQVQEENLAYVAATRSKFVKNGRKVEEPGTLLFLGPKPAIYTAKKSAAKEVLVSQ